MAGSEKPGRSRSYDFTGDPSIVESYVSALRKKIDLTEQPLVHTVRGVGYSLRVPRR